MPSGIGSHQSARSVKDEWFTPPEIVSALGPFDLDPCTLPDRPWNTAARHLTLAENGSGLLLPWSGCVWCNPPYGRETGAWLEAMAAHGNGIALVFARTETTMFHDHVWPKASALLFLRGRLHFHHKDGSRASANSGAPSVLISYGAECATRLELCGIPGALVRLSLEDQTSCTHLSISGDSEEVGDE